MSAWQVNVHVEDEEAARNLMEELNRDGFGVTLLKREVRERVDMEIQFCLMPPKKEVNA